MLAWNLAAPAGVTATIKQRACHASARALRGTGAFEEVIDFKAISPRRDRPSQVNPNAALDG
jgi:hypothetical protein